MTKRELDRARKRWEAENNIGWLDSGELATARSSFEAGWRAAIEALTHERKEAQMTKREIEVVAMAICNDCHKGSGWDNWRDVADEDRDAWRKTARAAIRALDKERKRAGRADLGMIVETIPVPVKGKKK